MKWNEHYMDRDSTAAVNGFFILLVFCRHILSYRELSGMIFLPIHWLSDYTGQFIVVSFLFFSGYGIMESCAWGGENYLRSIPKKRVLATWIRFALVVFLYLLLGLAMGQTYELMDLLEALVGWTSVGNSSWYVFVILWMYFFTWIAGTVSGREEGIMILIQTVLTALLILTLMQAKEEFWYNTALAYPAGMLFSSLRERWEKVTKDRLWCYFLQCALALVLWAVLFPLREHVWAYMVAAVLFAYTLVLFLCRVNVAHKYLIWLGRHLFGLYMGQRFCMIIMQRRNANDVWYFLICFAAMIGMGWVIDRATRWAAQKVLSI